MSVLFDIGRLGAALRNARRNRQTFDEMNALPAAVQRDIGWPANPAARSTSTIRPAYWLSLQ